MSFGSDVDITTAVAFRLTARNKVNRTSGGSNRIDMIQNWLSAFGTVLELYSVPPAAAVLGWMFGDQLTVWIVDRVAASSIGP
jgi:hypothetical protein